MSILKANITKFSFSANQLKALIAQDLGKKESDIDVHFIIRDVSDERFGGGANYALTEVEVIVNK
jgi:hypothetical protein